MKADLRCGAFSLVETAVSLGIVAFAMVAMLGLLPVCLKEEAASIAETQETHLATAVFAALRTPPFTRADCFGAKLDLSTLDEAAAPVFLYARFPASGDPAIGPVSDAGAGFGSSSVPERVYLLKLQFQKLALAGSQAPAAANRVTVTIQPQNQQIQPKESLRFQSIVGNY